MSLCSSLNRENKSTSKTTSKTQTVTRTSDDGSGSVADGLNCPKMEITPISPKSATVTIGTWSFKPASMETRWKDGFEIENFNPNTLLLKDIMVRNAPNGKLYIPWRFIDENDVEEGKVTFGNKWLKFKVVTDSNQIAEIKMYMPWKQSGDFIETFEVIAIQNNIITQATTIKNSIISSKTSLKLNVQELATELGNKEKISQSAETVKANAIKENDLIKKSLDAKATQLNSIGLQIATKASELSGLLNQRDTLNSETSKLSSDIEGDTLLLNAESRQKAITAAAGKIIKYKREIIQEINQIKTLASDDYCIAAATEAQAAAFAFNFQAMGTSFKKIYSTNEFKP